MQSFRTEIENPVVERDIIELARKIQQFQEGTIDEERFRSLRLARGVYGQRQPGVQMIRIKLPYGRLTTQQLRRICEVSEEYSTGKLHITTRQDIQIHYVSLDRTPELWAQLEKDDITLREACGNTVRNVTGSPMAGIDPDEPFDITPYAHAFFSYFLRNPVCQEMGRKFKVSFSSSVADTAFGFMHDLGFIPKLQKDEHGEEVRGFKVMIGGGLGAQAMPAQVAYEFLPADEVIPFAEAILRIFDRYGERAKRFKARFKFLLKQKGLAEIFRLVAEERASLPYQKYPIDLALEEYIELPEVVEPPLVEPALAASPAYQEWLQTNVFTQKQPTYRAVAIKVQLGDIDTQRARLLADLIEQYAGNDIRLTVNQDIVLRYVRPEYLPYLYQALKQLDLADSGFDSTVDITACPGTDTCNLGIANSTRISQVLEQVMREEYPDLIHNTTLQIKISGCMNACGQHTIAGIGFHGSTIKVGKQVAPALQILLGGARLGDGRAHLAEKVVKVPSKRGPQALRDILDDFEAQREEGEYFYEYYRRQGKNYFFQLLKPLTITETLQETDYQDWGHEDTFVPEIGVGECASVIIDLVATLVYEGKEKLDWAMDALVAGQFADGMYHSYSAMVIGAKALLVDAGQPTNTQAGIIKDFDDVFVRTGKVALSTNSFSELVYRMRKQAPAEDVAKAYLTDARVFLSTIESYRNA